MSWRALWEPVREVVPTATKARANEAQQQKNSQARAASNTLGIHRSSCLSEYSIGVLCMDVELEEIKVGDVYEGEIPPEAIALAVWTLRNHPWWHAIIKPKMKNPNYDNAYEINSWIRQSVPIELTRKLHRKMEREMAHEESYMNHNMMVFHSWSTETKDALCRAWLHETHGVSMEKPRLIIT